MDRIEEIRERHREREKECPEAFAKGLIPYPEAKMQSYRDIEYLLSALEEKDMEIQFKDHLLHCEVKRTEQAEARVADLEGALVSLECVIPEDYPKKGYPVVIHKMKYVVIMLSDFTEMQKTIFDLESRLAAAEKELEIRNASYETARQKVEELSPIKFQILQAAVRDGDALILQLKAQLAAAREGLGLIAKDEEPCMDCNKCCQRLIAQQTLEKMG